MNVRNAFAHRWTWLLVASSVWCPFAFSEFDAATAPRPNIVFVIADDCTFRDIGCYGGQAHTPNIDSLADQGMRMTRCFQTSPMCSPTRHSIYTGLFPIRSGAYPNHTRVDPTTASIVQHLEPLGYRVIHSGKSHVQPSSVFAWDHVGKAKTIDFEAIRQKIGGSIEQEQPFCLLVCSNEPHTPWNRGDRSRYPDDRIRLPPYLVDTPETRDGMARYLAEITYFDDQVEKTLALLEEYDIVDQTLVVVVSEQGNSLPFAKWTCYDSGLQSACIIRWPGHVEPSSVNSAMIQYIDFLPTFIEVAGGQPDPQLDGRSLLPVMAGSPNHRSHVFGQMTTRGIHHGSEHFGIRSVRSDRYKYIWNFTPEVEFRNACTESPEFQSWIRQANAGDEDAKRLVHQYRWRDAIELYDIQNDPLELNNLADDPGLADVQADLKQRLDRWMSDCGDRGQATEMAALEHQNRARKKTRSAGKKKSSAFVPPSGSPMGSRFAGSAAPR